MSTELTLPDENNDPGRFDDKFDRIVKHWRDRRPDDDPKRIKLPKDLQLQLEHWILIHGILATGRYPRTTQQLNAILKAVPGLSPRTARNYLEDTKKFFAMADIPNLAYEKMLLLDELRDDMRIAKKRGDMKALASFRKLYAELIGADKAEQAVENRTLINVINFNPELLGGKQMPAAQLDKMIESFMSYDKKKQSDLFSDYEDVTSPQTTP